MADTFIKRVRRLTAIDIFLWVVRIAAVVFIVIGSVQQPDERQAERAAMA